MKKYKNILLISTKESLYISLLIPYPSVQHFIWPLHWCLLADICNHTYIPECGTEHPEDIYDRRLFTDECDLYEYNCDYVTDYYPINYSSCFNLPPRACPPVIPCPSIPTCPDHRFHTTTTTSTATTSTATTSTATTSTTTTSTTSTTSTVQPVVSTVDMTIPPNTPRRMLVGRRRYSPTFRKKRRRKTTWPMGVASPARRTIKRSTPTTTRTKILKRITVKKNGRVFVKIVKAIIKKSPYRKRKYDSEFLE